MLWLLNWTSQAKASLGLLLPRQALDSFYHLSNHGWQEEFVGARFPKEPKLGEVANADAQLVVLKVVVIDRGWIPGGGGVEPLICVGVEVEETQFFFL